MIEHHFDSVREAISELGWITETVSVQSEVGPIDSMGIISGTLIFKDGSVFHFKEVHLHSTRKYRFHYMDQDNLLICRWDNAPHHQELRSFPDHAHFKDEIRESGPMKLVDALHQIEEWVSDRLLKEFES